MDSLFDKVVGVGLTVLVTVVSWLVKTILVNKEQVEILKASLKQQEKSMQAMQTNIDGLRKDFKEDLKTLKEDLVLIYKMSNK